MENMRLFYRGMHAEKEVEKYKGFLPTVIDRQVAEELCNLQAGIKISDKDLSEKLIEHNIVVEKNSSLYSTIPMLSYELSQAIEREIKDKFASSDFSGVQIVERISKKLPEKWQTTSHGFMSQLVLGVLWFNMWLRLSESHNEPSVVLIPDIDINHVFFNEMYPLLVNNVIVFWQSTLLGHPDTVYDIFNDKNVRASLQKINDKFEFIPIGDTLISLRQLNMYKNRPDENKMPVPYVNLPTVEKEMVYKVASELREMAELFNFNQEILSEIATKFYSERSETQQQVSYHSFRQMIYLVFSYCVVEAWLNSGVFPEPVKCRDKKRKQKSPKWHVKYEVHYGNF